MGTPRKIEKRFNNFGGIDLRSSDLIRDDNASPSLLNTYITTQSDLEKRPGNKWQTDTANAPYLGNYTYRWVDQTTGGVNEQAIGLDTKLKKLSARTLTITYVGVAATANFSFLPDDTTGVFTGSFDQAGTITTVTVTAATSITAFVAAFPAGFNGVISASGATLAEALPLTVIQDCKTSSLVLTFYVWEDVNSTVTTPFSTYEAAKYGEAFQNASVVNYQDSAIIGTGYQYLYKYDGQTVYRLGLPEFTASSAFATTLVGGAPGFADTSIKYAAVYYQKDNRGKINYGIISDYGAAVTPAAQGVQVTLTNILAGTGFNTNCALAQANVGVAPVAGLVTINVQNTPHTMKAGDTAYFYNSQAGIAAFKEYVVSSVTVTTLVLITTDTVSTTNNLVISNNLRIGIYRTTAGGNFLYNVVDIPNNSFAATQNYTDQTGVRGAQWEDPVYFPDLLTVKPRFLCVHQGCLCAAGDFQNPDTVYFSDPANPEGFSLADHNFECQSQVTTSVSGIFSDREVLLTLKPNALYAVQGDLPSVNFRVEKINEGDIGTSSHLSIAEIPTGIVFVSDKSVYLSQSGSQITEIGLPIRPLFVTRGVADSFQLNTKRAVSAYSRTLEMFICYIPAETNNGTQIYPNDNSIVIAYDFKRDGWHIWNGINAAQGFFLLEDNLHFGAKEFDSTMVGRTWMPNTTGLRYDYNDHKTAIEWDFYSQWEDGGEPSVFKIALRHVFYSFSPTAGAFTVDCKTERNYLPGVFHSIWTSVFGTVSSGTGWGSFPWGITTWGNPSVTRNKVKLKSGKFQSLRYFFHNEAINTNVSITGYETELSPPYNVKVID